MIKVTNPAWVVNIAPEIERFCAKLNLPNVSYHSLVAHLQRTAQIGGEIAELWIALEDDRPVGFAHWCVRDLPLVGTVYMDYLFSKAMSRRAIKGLIAEFIDFGRRKNSPWYMFDLVNNARLIGHIKKLAAEFGFEMIEQPYIPYLARKKK